jgi:hypothetical protein
MAPVERIGLEEEVVEVDVEVGVRGPDEEVVDVGRAVVRFTA